MVFSNFNTSTITLFEVELKIQKYWVCTDGRLAEMPLSFHPAVPHAWFSRDITQVSEVHHYHRSPSSLGFLM